MDIRSFSHKRQIHIVVKLNQNSPSDEKTQYMTIYKDFLNKTCNSLNLILPVIVPYFLVFTTKKVHI